MCWPYSFFHRHEDSYKLWTCHPDSCLWLHEGYLAIVSRTDFSSEYHSLFSKRRRKWPVITTKRTTQLALIFHYSAPNAFLLLIVHKGHLLKGHQRDYLLCRRFFNAPNDRKTKWKLTLAPWNIFHRPLFWVSCSESMVSMLKVKK